MSTQQIRIISFRRIQRKEQEQYKKIQLFKKDIFVMNIILYAEQQNEKINDIQKWIRSQHLYYANIIKLLQSKSIIHAIKKITLNQSKKTYFITTQSLTQQIINLVKANQSPQFASLFQQLKFIILANSIQQITSQHFWINNISLITTSINQLKEFLQDQFLQPFYNKNNVNSVSSVNSQDQSAFQEQFLKVYNPISLPKQSPKKQDKNNQIVFNSTPGVGEYNVSYNQSFKGTTSGTFAKSKK